MLQGHVPTRYKRWLHKGDFEIKFTKDGFWYRPWYQNVKGAKIGNFEYKWVKGHDGGKVNQPIPHESSIETAIKNGEVKDGPANLQGHFKLKGLVGVITRVASIVCDVTFDSMSFPNALETNFYVRATRDMTMQFFDKPMPEPRTIQIEKGKVYRYMLKELVQESWYVSGPFPEHAQAVDPVAAAREEMSEAQLNYVEMAAVGTLPDHGKGMDRVEDIEIDDDIHEEYEEAEYSEVGAEGS